MKLRMFSILIFVLFVGGIYRSPSQVKVVLVQRFPLLPIKAMNPGAYLHGDESCKYFFLTYYGDPGSGKAHITLNHDDQGTRKDESFSPERLAIIFEDIAAPYATHTSDDEVWKIHISQTDYDTKEKRCLTGVAVAQ